MLLMIFLVLLLLLVQVFLPGKYLTDQIGPQGQMGPRDDLPEPSRDLGRARRALANLQETLPIFLTLAILCIVYNEQGWLPLLGAVVYLVSRIAHVICYMRAFAPWRSIFFLLGLIGNGIMAIALLPHIWS
jgi:uncharacterized MAPEG superfamily protein